jgi:hypothetical protein
MLASRTKKGMAAAALCGCLALSGCGPAGAYNLATASYGGQDNICTASADNPTSGVATTGGTGIEVQRDNLTNMIVGQVWVTCDPSPISHVMKVELWFMSISGHGPYEEVASKTYTNIPSSTESTLYSATRWCTPGFWQVRWSVVGHDDQAQPYAFSDKWKYSLVDYNDCIDKPEPTSGHTEAGPVSVE